MPQSSDQPTYHALLVGISAYPPRYNSLNGCVNDIDAIENLLLDSPGIGIPAEQIRIRRLAAPRRNAVSSSRFQAKTLFPSKQNLVAEFNTLAGPDIKPTDRVLIYYSGHGLSQQTADMPTHEMLVLNGGDDIQYLYDVDLNRYLAAIAARTTDLTVVLDCCHSAGATRGFLDGEPQGAARFLRANDGNPLPKPDLTDRAGSPMHMLAALDPEYVTLVACQAEESAHEGSYNAGQPQGALTLALLQLLKPLSAESRAQTRWTDIFPSLLDCVGVACTSLRQPSQQPALLGRSERRIFGGEWRRQDPGFSVHRHASGRYLVASGTLLGVTRGAVLAVYGPEPPEFPTLETEEDKKARIGTLQVVSAERATCLAEVIDAQFDPTGARARLVQPGEKERLRVILEPPDPKLCEFLEASDLLRIVPPNSPDSEVKVIQNREGGWTIRNDVPEELADVPPEEEFALRAGLESYYRYNLVLRMAGNCHDRQLANLLSVHILDCNDREALASADMMNPIFSEAPRDQDGVYKIPADFRFCIEVLCAYDANLPQYVLDANLRVALFDCGAGGEAQYLGDTPLLWHQAQKQGDRQVVWRRNELRRPFVAGPDFDHGGTDRIVAVAATRKDLDLRGLEVSKTIQRVVNDNLSTRRGSLGGEEGKSEAVPAELWTAVIVPFRIGPSEVN